MIGMVVVRPVDAADVDPLLELASMAGFGLTTLPHDRDLLAERVRASQHAFAKPAGTRVGGDAFLFVMEDLATGHLVGTAGIVSKVGGFEPFYAYRIEKAVHASEMLNVHKEIETLHLVAEHNGPCEIGTLFLNPEYRAGGIGRMLSLSRFLFMADRPDLFDPVVIAEMRGVIDERGGSVFWDAIGRHFFEIEFPKADQLSFVNKQFIAELMPHHPIYIPLLPGPAQEVIGQVHEHTRPARRILEQEGFTFSGMVDIFEAGPVMSCQRDQIRTVRESVVTTVGSIIDTPPEGAPRMLARTGEAFRVCLGAVAMDESGKATLSSKSALALGVKVGDSLRVAPLRAATTSKDK